VFSPLCIINVLRNGYGLGGAYHPPPTKTTPKGGNPQLAIGYFDPQAFLEESPSEAQKGSIT